MDQGRGDSLSPHEAGAGENPAVSPEAGRAALVRELAGIEAQIRHGEAVRRQIGQVAGAMRDQAHGHVVRIEGQGLHSPEARAAYARALEDRRHCDVVAGLTRA